MLKSKSIMIQSLLNNVFNNKLIVSKMNTLVNGRIL